MSSLGRVTGCDQIMAFVKFYTRVVQNLLNFVVESFLEFLKHFMFLSGCVIEIQKIFISSDHISYFLCGNDLFMTHYENGLFYCRNSSMTGKCFMSLLRRTLIVN